MLGAVADNVEYYEVGGYVYGRVWAGYAAAMKLNGFTAPSYGEVMRIAEERLADGSLGTGDFESLDGARLVITKVSIVGLGGNIHDEITYNRFIGDLSEKNKRWLRELYD